jgi:hypothetical protein
MEHTSRQMRRWKAGHTTAMQSQPTAFPMTQCSTTGGCRRDATLLGAMWAWPGWRVRMIVLIPAHLEVAINTVLIQVAS